MAEAMIAARRATSPMESCRWRRATASSAASAWVVRMSGRTRRVTATNSKKPRRAYSATVRPVVARTTCAPPKSQRSCSATKTAKRTMTAPSEVLTSAMPRRRGSCCGGAARHDGPSSAPRIHPADHQAKAPMTIRWVKRRSASISGRAKSEAKTGSARERRTTKTRTSGTVRTRARSAAHDAPPRTAGRVCSLASLVSRTGAPAMRSRTAKTPPARTSRTREVPTEVAGSPAVVMEKKATATRVPKRLARRSCSASRQAKAAAQATAAPSQAIGSRARGSSTRWARCSAAAARASIQSSHPSPPGARRRAVSATTPSRRARRRRYRAPSVRALVVPEE